MVKLFSAVGAVAVATALLLPTASLASTMTAAPDAEQISAKVSYRDLDLGKAAGSDALRDRIANAAQQVCGSPRPVELADIAASRTCIAGAIASAQPAYETAVAAARRGTVTVTTGAALIVTAPTH